MDEAKIDEPSSNYRISNGVLDDYVELWTNKDDSHFLYNFLVNHEPNIFNLKKSSPIKQAAIPIRDNLRRPIPDYQDYVTKKYPGAIAAQILRDSDQDIISKLDIAACKYNVVIDSLVIDLVYFLKLPKREKTFLQETARDTIALIQGKLSLNEYTRRSTLTIDKYLGTGNNSGQTLTNSFVTN